MDWKPHKIKHFQKIHRGWNHKALNNDDNKRKNNIKLKAKNSNVEFKILNFKLMR